MAWAANMICLQTGNRGSVSANPAPNDHRTILGNSRKMRNGFPFEILSVGALALSPFPAQDLIPAGEKFQKYYFEARSPDADKEAKLFERLNFSFRAPIYREVHFHDFTREGDFFNGRRQSDDHAKS
ncbi:hypothetical protein LB516_15825 [Mesorhizobium sp. CO1-1-7]|uniref:hypothetical protein n=1 Tax=Mesorhizobium sp. CO1-1-7 TaxID=2876632 RepID=UPI001127F27E|nr:hypothetical protein [Mesorhizobium sp. CO1-1-7]MBZ9746722.1 hypothetical protein [Mesorhizobium sp. CO1-1-7]TPK71933.1 hypothetical protein FJ527_25680 [Mesorhizobium sp. B2-4-18]